MPDRQIAQSPSQSRPRSREEVIAEAEQFIESMQALLRVTSEEIQRARVCMQCAWDPSRCPERRASGQCEMNPRRDD